MKAEAADLQDQLLEALLEGNFSEFQELLGHPAVNPNHKYGKPHFSTCLEIAARHHGRHLFVKELLGRVKPNINQIIPEPIHYAASKGNDDVLEVLLEDKRTKVNAEDSYGRTALHHAAKNFTDDKDGEKYERCIWLLMACLDLDINRANKKGFTAIHEAAASGSKRAVLTMLKYGKQDIDIDSSRGHGRTAREVIINKYPELKEILPLPKLLVIPSPDPESQLILALQTQQYVIFTGLLQQVDTDGNALMDPNFWYGKPLNTTCLEMACREDSGEEFVQALLQAGSDPNMVNLISEKSPIHVAAECGNYGALRVLLSDPRTNINVVDREGNTALHCMFHHREEKAQSVCLSLLIQHPDINMNIVNKGGCTPILTAALSNNEEAVRLILQYKGDSVDLDSQVTEENSAREVIVKKYPDLESILPKSRPFQTVVPNVLGIFSQYLHKRQTKQFIEIMDKQVSGDFNEQFLNGNDGSNTFLQYACRHGLYDVADKLLQLGANPNETHENCKWPPVVLAASRRHHDILVLFLKLPTRVKFDIDATDVKGNTALHYTAKFGDLKSTLALLSHGANVKLKNVFDKPPLPAKAVETLLNQCLISDGSHYPEEEDYKLKFNYGILVPQTKEEPHLPELIPVKNNNGFQNLNAEMDFLFFLSQSNEHRPLLKHPIITSFLHLKWHRVRPFFYLNLLIYCIFVALLNAYILLGYESDHVNRDYSAVEAARYSTKLVGCFLMVLLSFLVIRELIQFSVSPKQYVCNLENYLDISVIILTAVTLFTNLGNETKNTVTVVTILLSWTELVLVTGRLPFLSRNIEMLKTVSWTFVRFMVWYSLIIVAFAISFYAMFRNAKSEQDSNMFSSPGTSVFKTIVMMTGELGSEDIPFEAANVTSHLVFIVFVFLIVIVLINLLTGLAVSDTQAIQNDAEILSLISRIRLVYDIESMLLQWHRSVFRIKFLKVLVQQFEHWIKDITLFPSTVSDKHFCVLPNKGLQIISPHSESTQACRMDLDMVSAAMDIIGSQSKTSDIDVIKMRLENIEKVQSLNKEVLGEVLDILQRSIIK